MRARRMLAVEPLEQRMLLTGDVTLPARLDAEGEGTLQVRFRLETTDLAGIQVDATAPGNDIYLNVWVSDIRAATSSAGVYAAYLDLTYDGDLLQLVPAPGNPWGYDIEFGGVYRNGISALVNRDGLIDEVGAFQEGFSPLGPDEYLLLRARFTTGDVQLQDDIFAGIPEDAGIVELDVLANDHLPVGHASFTANGADFHPAHEVLLFSPPTVVAESAIEFVGTELAITDQGPLVISRVSAAASGGTVRVSPDGGRLLYTPAADFWGVDSFTYYVGESAGATVTVVVDPVNDAPRTRDDIYSTGFAQTLVVDAARGVLGNDYDVEGQSLVAQLMEMPQYGTVQWQADGSFVYTPSDDFRGRDQFTYVAGDGELWSESAMVRIDVGTPQVLMRLEVISEAGEPVERLSGADSLLLRAVVQDLRGESYLARGVFAAYLDVLYQAGDMQPRWDAGQPLGFEISSGPEYYSPVSGRVAQAGVIDEVGTFARSFEPLGADPQILWEIPFDPVGPKLAPDSVQVRISSSLNVVDVLGNDLELTWDVPFAAEPADESPHHDTLLYDPPQRVLSDQMLLAGTSVEMSNDPALVIVSVGESAVGGTVSISADQRQLLYSPPPGFLGTDTFTYIVADSHGRRGEAEVVVEVVASWQNPRNPLDVNDDSHVSPIDVLLIISDLNRHGAHPLAGTPTGAPYLDVSGDGSVSPIDALLIIDHLNRGGGEGESPEGESVEAVWRVGGAEPQWPLPIGWSAEGSGGLPDSPSLAPTRARSVLIAVSVPWLQMDIRLPELAFDRCLLGRVELDRLDIRVQVLDELLELLAAER